MILCILKGPLEGKITPKYLMESAKYVLLRFRALPGNFLAELVDKATIRDSTQAK